MSGARDTAGDVVQRYDPFVAQIIKICREEPGRRAALRRGLGRSPQRAYTMHASVAPWLAANAEPAVEFAYYAVAAMIAAQTRSTSEPTSGGEVPAGRRNLGFSLAWGVRRPGAGRRALAEGSAEKRLHLLVRQSLDGLHRQLPGVIRHLGVVGVPVDWSQLIYDLSRWSKARDSVAKAWLQAFYRTLHATAPEE